MSVQPYAPPCSPGNRCPAAVCAPRIVNRSNFLTASDVIAARKRTVISQTYFNDIKNFKNPSAKYPNLLLSVLAANANQVQEIGRANLPKASELPVPQCCTVGSYASNSVTTPPVPRQGPRIWSLRPYA